jgi:flagellar biosynthesis/type III secretory pathway protein FliH
MPYVTSVERRALERGRIEGHKKGREEGREEAREAAREAGAVAGWRFAVLQVLEARLGAVPERVRQLVDAETDLSRLQSTIRVAAVADSWEELDGQFPATG